MKLKSETTESFDYNNIITHMKATSDSLPEQRTDEWLKFRKDKLTGSDFADAVGLGYGGSDSKRRQLLFKKCGYDPKPFTGNDATIHGTRYEPVAQSVYESKTGNRVVELNILPFPDSMQDHSFLAYSPDGVAIVKDDTTEVPVLIEIKCPYRRKIESGVVPSYYYPQLQFGLQIMKAYGIDTVCHFIQFKPGPVHEMEDYTLDITVVERDDDWWNTYFPKAAKFWKDVQKYRELGVEAHPGFVHPTPTEFVQPVKLNIQHSTNSTPAKPRPKIFFVDSSDDEA